MKKVLFVLAAALFVFAGCQKDNLEKNKVTFGNVSADINIGACGYTDSGHLGAGYHLDVDADLNGVNSHFFLNFNNNCKGKKINLGKYDGSVTYHFEINSSSEGYPYDIHHYNDSDMASEISHSSVGTWFKSGTMELKDDGKEITLNVDAVTQDGRNFKLNITAKSQKFV